MSAVETIQALLTLGVEVKTGVTKSGQTLSSFLQSSDFATIEDSVTRLLEKLKPSDLKSAIDAIQKKESDLRAGRTLAALSSDEIVQFHALLDLEDKLVNKLLTEPDRTNFLTVLVNEVLPVLVQIGRIVIPLLT